MPPFTLNLKQRRARKHMPPKPEALDCVLPPAANPPTARPPARQRHRAPGQFLPPPRRHVQRRRGRVSRSTPCDRTPWTPAGHLPPPLRARNGAGRGRSALFVASLAGSRFAGEWPCGRRRRPGLDGISFTIRPGGHGGRQIENKRLDPKRWRQARASLGGPKGGQHGPVCY